MNWVQTGTSVPQKGAPMPALRTPLLVFLLTFIGACHSDGRPKPGYSGDVPSALAQQLLLELRGTEFSDATGVLSAGTWEVAGFAVIPNASSPSGKGPVVRIDQGRDSIHVPLESDGDVADFFFRVTNRTAPDFTGPLSTTYRAFWDKK